MNSWKYKLVRIAIVVYAVIAYGMMGIVLCSTWMENKNKTYCDCPYCDCVTVLERDSIALD